LDVPTMKQGNLPSPPSLPPTQSLQQQQHPSSRPPPPSASAQPTSQGGAAVNDSIEVGNLQSNDHSSSPTPFDSATNTAKTANHTSQALTSDAQTTSDANSIAGFYVPNGLVIDVPAYLHQLWSVCQAAAAASNSSAVLHLQQVRVMCCSRCAAPDVCFFVCEPSGENSDNFIVLQ
jgi:hypothetical protein